MKKDVRRSAPWAIAVLLAILHTTALARTWNVQADGLGDSPTIQAAINCSQPGDTVLVEFGFYTWETQGGGVDTALGPAMINMRSGITLLANGAVVDAQEQGCVIVFCETHDAVVEGFFQITGGFLAGKTAGIICDNSTNVNILNNFIQGNGSPTSTAAIITLRESSALLRSNVVTGNSAATIVQVDGIQSSVILLSNTVGYNRGDGIRISGGSVTIQQNVVAYHYDGAPVVCEGVCGSTTSLSCNLFWANALGNEFCGTDLGGNITANPNFCNELIDPSNHAKPTPISPCLPENNSCGVLIGALGVGCPTSSIEAPANSPTLEILPNPLSRNSRILVALSERSPVNVGLYDVRGRLVQVIYSGSMTAGDHYIAWSARANGLQMAVGVYFLRLETPQSRILRKVMVLN